MFLKVSFTIYGLMLFSLQSKGSILTLFVGKQWPAAYALAAYVSTLSPWLEGKCAVELGAGTGLPSLVASKLGAALVLVSERVHESENMRLLGENLQANDAKNIEIVPLNWGDSFPCPACVDIILGADILYSSEDFDTVLATVASIMEVNINAIFLTTYQERSVHRSLLPYLDKYNMRSREIPMSSFLHPVHFHGSCLMTTAEDRIRDDTHDNNDNNDRESSFITKDGRKRTRLAVDSTEDVGGDASEHDSHRKTLQTFDDIYLIEICSSSSTTTTL
eukprot:gene1090-2121_t